VIVIDACVAVKWFLPEDNSEQALRLVQGNEILLAPDLLRIEVASAILVRARRNEIEVRHAKEALSMWFEALKDGVIQVNSGLEDARDAGNFALQLGHPVYDCLYLAVARRTSSRLVTADRKFAEKAKSVFANIEVL
jgi:predicted nucleic acid-binding protein